MALPLILGAKAVGAIAGRIRKRKPTGRIRRRRARRRLTSGEIMELTTIKNLLGRTAAANALPYYMGRGR